MAKTAYLWGSISSFSGPLAAWLLQKGWHVHIATKSALHFALSPLDITSTAQEYLKRSLSGQERFKTFQDRLRLLDVDEFPRGTKYDAIIFCGLPPNFDEARVPRAPWAAEQLSRLTRRMPGVPVFIVSSIWGAVQADGAVPETIDCQRRKARSPFESVCQQYELKLLKGLRELETPWYLVRLPMISCSTCDGWSLKFSGMLSLLERLQAPAAPAVAAGKKSLQLSFNPDATLYFMPIDVAVYLFWRLLEDEERPRICNLVPTQATLNREWLQDLARVLGYAGAEPVAQDAFNLPRFLHSALSENVQVKARGLFEVMGRYQQSPTILDAGYFERMLAFASAENWGKLQSAPPASPGPDLADEMIADYFLNFLPANADVAALRMACGEGGSLGFVLDGLPGMAWVLTLPGGQPQVRPADQDPLIPRVRFTFTRSGLARLAQRKISLEQALVTREARVEGRAMDILRALNFLRRFFTACPYSPVRGKISDPRPSGVTAARE